MSQWLCAGLVGTGLEAVLLETRHVKAILRHVIDDLACDRILYLDHVIERGAELFKQVRIG